MILQLRKYKEVLLINALFMAVLLGGNSIAQSMGWVPAKELIRTARTRTGRTGRRIREIFIEDDN